MEKSFPGVGEKNHRFFEENGYLILKNPHICTLKFQLWSELKIISLGIISKFPDYKAAIPKLSELSFQDIFDWALANEENNCLSRAFYEVFPTSPEVISWIASEHFLSLARGLGLKHPLASTLPLLRIDRGGEDRFSTPVHQDYWFAMLSPNCITYWLSILPVVEEMGPLWIIPSSHKLGVLPVKVWSQENPFTTARDFSDGNFLPVLLAEDEILIFHQCLVHKSGKNNSKKARLTLQLRYNDLETLIKPTSSFTVTHSHYTKEAQKSLLKDGL